MSKHTGAFVCLFSVLLLAIAGCNKPTKERVSPSTDDTITFRFHTPPDLEGKMYMLSTWFSDSPDCEEKNEVLGIQRSGRFGKVTYSTLHNGTWEIVAPTKLEDPLCKWDFNRFAIGFSDSEAVGKLENTLAHMYLEEGSNGSSKIAKLECDRSDFDYLVQGVKDRIYSIKCHSIFSSNQYSNNIPALIAYRQAGPVNLHLAHSGKKMQAIRRVNGSIENSKKIFSVNGTLTNINVSAQFSWWELKLINDDYYQVFYTHDYRGKKISKKMCSLAKTIWQILYEMMCGIFLHTF